MSKKLLYVLSITVIIVLTSYALFTNAADSYSFSTKWGTSGTTGNGEFQFPYDIAIDSSGNVYVTDTYNHRIQKFTSSGTFISTWGSEGPGDGQFSYPIGIAIHGDDVYIVDDNNHRIQKFSTSGVFITKWGGVGSADGQFANPYGIAVDPSGDVYVADTFNQRIQKFSSTGTFITKWGSAGTGDGQFQNPVFIAADSSGFIYVTDQDNSRVQKFTSAGVFVTKWGTAGTADGQFLTPLGIKVDSSGNIFVVDQGNNHVEKFDSNGTYLDVMIGEPGSGDGQFDGPIGIAIDASDNIYVVDTNNQRIQKFTPDNPAPTFGTLDPSSIQQGDTKGITITGVDFLDNVTSVDFGNDITVNSLTVESSTRMIASITATRSAAVGLRDISITNSAPGGGTTVATLAFTVIKKKQGGVGGFNPNPEEIPRADSSPDMPSTAPSLTPVIETPVPKICNPYITIFMRRGAIGEQVIKLQTFLVKEDVYAEGLITGYFGTLTEAAVNRFQLKYAADILTPQNLFAPTGFARDFTQKKVNEIACNLGL